jgi:RNA polymerase sigma-70 factor (ECF subfamily)
MQDVREDIEIVKDLIHGSEAAFNELFHKYNRWIFLAALKICAPHSQDAQDVVMEVFTKLWERRSKLKPELSVRSLLYTMASNACKDKIEKRNTALRLNVKYMEGESFLENPKTTEHTELSEQLNKAIERISAPATRQVVKMYYMDGLSYKEITEETGMKIQTARKFVSQGLSILKNLVKNRH